MCIEHTELVAFLESQGWSDFGIVPVSEVKVSLSKHKKYFESWSANGFYADMDYLNRMEADRFHPEHKLSGLRSFIVLQSWYGTSASGNVARYARGRDYHRVLKKRLKQLSDWLKSKVASVETFASVDSGPVVDRVLAEAAGLGFFGKHSNLIDPFRGSYFFIASLMTNLDLPATKKRRMPNCGDCRRCMDACPTGAIVAPGVIDARRCIAYLTIENKGGIHEEFRSAIGSHLFGCDACQEVCPFNEKRVDRQVLAIDELTPESGVGEELDLAEILKVENDEVFQDRFAGTPLMRAKRRGLIRNACVVAGNRGDKSLLPLLKRLAELEKDDMLREHAQWAVGILEGRL